MLKITFKKSKNIINMYFNIKNYLKNNTEKQGYELLWIIWVIIVILTLHVLGSIIHVGPFNLDKSRE